MRACQDPSPVIDGRRANCNLACLGAAHRTRPPTPQYGMGRFRPQAIASAYRGPQAASVSTAYYHQPAQYAMPYSFYGYSGYSQENIYPVNYFGVGAQQQQFSPYYPAAAAAAAAATTPGVYPGYYPFYAQYSHQSTAQAHTGFGLHYPQMLQYPYLTQQFGSASAILSLPAAAAAAAAAPASFAAPTAGVNVGPASMAMASSSSSQPPRTAPDQH